MTDSKPEAEAASDQVVKSVEDQPTSTEQDGKATSAEKDTQDSVKKSDQDGKANGRKPPRRNFQDNVKTDFSSQPESNDPIEIRKQVEFYFSDSNLYQDKFLFKETGGSKNLPVPIKVIHNFKRMRRFQPYSAVVAALKESDFLEVTDKEELKRKTPLPELTGEGQDSLKVIEDRTQPRSIYAKGFGEEGPSTQFDIEAFFMPYGPINAVRLRRTQEKLFKGSVFVEFDSEETQKAFLALENKPKYKDRDLVIMGKKEYCEMKIEEIKAGKTKPNSNHRGNKGKNFRGGRHNNGNRSFNRNRDAERERKDKNQRDNKDEKGDDLHGPIKKFDSSGVPILETSDDIKGEATQPRKRAHEDDGADDAGSKKS